MAVLCDAWLAGNGTAAVGSLSHPRSIIRDTKSVGLKQFLERGLLVCVIPWRCQSCQEMSAHAGSPRIQ